MATNKQKVIVVVGPTASGKTSLAIEIAKKYHGEVISADSRQVYRGLDVGTAKITEAEMDGIPHHLIDIVDIDTVYTATDFKRDAASAISNITVRGHVPVIAGGTFFYIDTLLERAAPPAVKPNPVLREQLEAQTVEALHGLLQAKDPRRAAEIDPQNKRRLVRALEIVDAIGTVPPPSEQESPYEVLMLGIQTETDDLRARLAARADNWIGGDLVAEVKGLLDAGVSRERLQEIGFEYMIGVDFLDGKLSETELRDAFIQKNWQYAKRQLTWLKRDTSINWISPSDKAEVDMLITSFLLNS